LAAFALVSLHALAAEATMEIIADKERLTFSQSQLLSRRDIQTISIADSVYKQRFTQFKSIPIANLFKGLAIPELAVGTGQLERGQALVYLNRCRVSRIMRWPSV
jgi:hypothetical protein